jgi:hypothetical protein
MTIPGMTTTRLHLLLAALCALTLSPQGWAAAGLLLVVVIARCWARHHLEAGARMAVALPGTGAATPVPTLGREAA